MKASCPCPRQSCLLLPSWLPETSVCTRRPARLRFPELPGLELGLFVLLFPLMPVARGWPSELLG